MAWRAVIKAAVLALMMAGAVFAAPAARFLADLNDVPLAPGLTELETERLVFDKPDGRIVRTAAVGPVAAATVFRFYRATLPQLGWSLQSAAESGPLVFLREGERLEISAEPARGLAPGESAKAITIRFFLEPR